MHPLKESFSDYCNERIYLYREAISKNIINIYTYKIILILLLPLLLIIIESVFMPFSNNQIKRGINEQIYFQ